MRGRVLSSIKNYSYGVVYGNRSKKKKLIFCAGADIDCLHWTLITTTARNHYNILLRRYY